MPVNSRLPGFTADLSLESFGSTATYSARRRYCLPTRLYGRLRCGRGALRWTDWASGADMLRCGYSSIWCLPSSVRLR